MERCAHEMAGIKHATYCRVVAWMLLMLPATISGQPREFPSVLPVIPAPVLQRAAEGTCVLRTSAAVCADRLHRASASELAALLASHGSVPQVRELPVADGTEADIRFIADPAVTAAEGYVLEITPRGVRIRASTEAGGYYGMQTLLQMLPASLRRGARPRALRLPCTRVEDAPRFSWRGVMLDCSRHFIPVPDLLRMIDRFAALKFNRLHLHLTDDQGWRLEIRSHPKLTDIGAWRGSGAQRDGGYYSQEEMRGIIAYAAERHISIIPEIDIPGHTAAALAAYPALDCFSRPRDVPVAMGPHAAVLCAGREWTYRFVADVLGEVAALFPARYIHIGGDEVRTEAWTKCYSCQLRRVELGYGRTDELRGYFTERVAGIVRDLGKTPIGWNETFGSAPTDMVIQAWHGMYIANRAAESGHPVICSPNAECYFDYDHEKNSIRNAYDFDPLDAARWDAGLPLPMGVECCLWTEETPTVAAMQRQLFPRAAAFAEVAWSVPAARGWESFRRRLGALGGHWTQEGTLFTPLRDITWDDGVPLTVACATLSRNGRLQVTCSVAIAQTGVIDDAPPQDVLSCMAPVRVTMPDERTLELAHTAEQDACFDNTPLLGIRKSGNPWSLLVDTTKSDALFRISDALMLPAALQFSVFPNMLSAADASPRLQLRFTLPVAGRPRLRVFDSAGRERLRLPLPEAEFGAQQVSVRPPPLAAGFYLLLLESGTFTGTAALRIR